MPQEETLLFVCNSNSGVLPRMKNYSANSSISPAEDCHLSALIYSPVGMKKEWKRFIREQKLPSQVLDRNEFREQYGYGITMFPVVLVRTGRGLAVLISTEELNRCRELEDLMGLLKQRLCPIP
ncbi:hypothetical protein [uncultured Methanoregula sp.]|uniref:hypothetical protein n=1 Tax=uncultured Methanoregula sp. TaxID=1005933 RepID=UPI002AABF75F|nr:hypothetical protein [uncultured Methanoregula sp.]